MGGSDKIFIELAKEWTKSGRAVAVFGCREAGLMCRRAGMGETFHEISTLDVEKVGLLRSYLGRSVAALREQLPIDHGILYSASDFLPDTTWAWQQKRRNPSLNGSQDST